MDNDDIKVANDKLVAASSVAFFRSNPLEVFRSDLLDAIRQVIHVSRKRSLSPHVYQRQQLDESLALVSWKELCQDHDKHMAKTIPPKDTLNAPNTSLVEIVTLLQDPTVVPHAICAVLFKAFLGALLDSPRRKSHHSNRNPSQIATRWSPSQCLLLRAMAQLWQTSPSVSTQSSTILESFLQEDSPHCTPNKWNRLLSAAAHLATDCTTSHALMMSWVISILRTVDEMEISAVKGQPNVPPTGPLSDTQTAVQKAKRVKMANLEQLHEEDNTTNDYRPMVLTKRPVSFGALSLKKVLSKRVDKPVTKPSKQEEYVKPVVPLLSDEWKLVRARGYKKFQTLFSLPTAMSPNQRNPVRFDIRHMLQTVHRHYTSPSVRVCLLLVANSMGRSCPWYYRVIAKTCWEHYRQDTPARHRWLRIYSELIVECAFFDNREECWSMVRPLLRHMETQGVEHPSILGREMFSCVAYVLSRRCRLFETHDDAIRDDFRACISYLSIHYGEAKFWLQGDGRDMDKQKMLSILQRAGIVGLMETTADFNAESSTRTGKECTEPSDELPLQRWPFAAPFDLRSAYYRMGRGSLSSSIDWTALLSLPTYDEDITNPGDKVVKSRWYQGTSPPMLDYLSGPDVLGQIFSFCGVKRLAKLRQVCTTWKETIDNSNNLWYYAYRDRFDFHPDDIRATESAWSTENWKTLLTQKWLSEKQLRHQRHGPTGWKHRTCAYIGCCHIMRSPRLECSHYASHARKEEAKNKKRRKPPKESATKKPRRQTVKNAKKEA